MTSPDLPFADCGVATSDLLPLVGLDAIAIGQRAEIRQLDSSGFLRRRLLDLGFVPGAVVTAARRSPLGDPTAYLIKGAVIALRDSEASTILVQPRARTVATGKGAYAR